MNNMYEPYNCYPVNATFASTNTVSRDGDDQRDERIGDLFDTGLGGYFSNYLTSMIDRKVWQHETINYFRSTTGIQCAAYEQAYAGDHF